MDNIAKKILEIAKAEVGYKEQKVNKTKYGAWFGFDGAAWCGMFVSWVYFHAGLPLGKIDFMKGFASCQFAFEYFKKKGWVVTDPQPGDIVFFDFDGKGKKTHTGLFEMWKDVDTFFDYEGNTALKNQTNGGQVMHRIRNKKVSVFVRIPRSVA